MSKSPPPTELSYEAYQKRLSGLEKPEVGPAKIFEIALAVRNFEIENYWRRANYFWLILAAIFAGYFAVGMEPDSKEIGLNRLILAFLGVLFSWAWYFANRGSKFWQENWEAHVDLLEPLTHGLLFQTVISAPRSWYKILSAYPFSVSKINALVSLTVAVLWSFLFAMAACKLLVCEAKWANLCSPYTVGIFLCVVAVPAILWCFTRASLKPGVIEPDKCSPANEARENRHFILKPDTYALARKNVTDPDTKPDENT